jgi:hypothetical protein
MNATATATATRFQTTTVGINAFDGETNLIDYTTGVQIWSGWGMVDGRVHEGGFRVGIPATVKNSGVKAVAYGKTLDEAFAIAAEIGVKAAAKMARLHAEALRMNA